MLSVYLSMAMLAEDNDKIAYIYTTYYSAMAYTIKSVLGDNSCSVDDLVHDTMLKLIDLIPQIDFSEPKMVKAFCCLVAKSQAIDYCKRKDNQNISIDEAITETVEDDSCPTELLIKKETYDEILSAIRSLDDKYRDVCTLKYLYKMKEKDIAKALSLPAGTVSVRIQRGRQILKNAIGKGVLR